MRALVGSAAALCFMFAIHCRYLNDVGMTFQDYGFWIGLGCTVVCAIYALLGYHFPKQTLGSGQSATSSGPKVWLIWLLILASLGCVSFDYFDRHYNKPVFSGRQLITSYGLDPIAGQTFWAADATVDSSLLTQYENDYKIIIIIRVSYANVDEMTDTHINKSTEFTITGQPISIAIPIVPNSSNLSFSTAAQNLLNFYLAMLPNGISPDQIFSLSDVRTLGGQILDRTGITLPPSTPATSPPAALLQAPAQQ